MNIFFGANDAGGANAIAPVLRLLKEKGHEVSGFAEGPAIDIFTRAGISYAEPASHSIESCIESLNSIRPDAVLLGTSMTYTIEKLLTAAAKRLQISTVAVLDFWISYSERFLDEQGTVAYVPDVICVMDENARKATEAAMVVSRIEVTGNPHFENIAADITTNSEDVHKIIFVAQPISEVVPGVYGLDEFSVLEGIIASMETLPADYSLSIRMHPREKAGKYDSYLSDRISISSELTLEDALSAAGLVIGIFSPVLLQAVAGGKRVVRFLPAFRGVDPLPLDVQDYFIRADTVEELKAVFERYAVREVIPVSDAKEFVRTQAHATERVYDVLHMLCG